MRSVLSTLLLFGVFASCVHAQTWQKLNLNGIEGDRRIFPKEANVVTTNGRELREFLLTAPHESRATAENSPVSLTVPGPDDQPLTFRIVGYDIAAPAGLAAYPEIRTYYGSNPEVPGQTIFLDWTTRGFHASIRGGGRPVIFIDPLFRGNTDHYQVYTRSGLGEETEEAFRCLTTEGPRQDAEPTGGKALGDCELMQYRTTITATAEYSNYHGADSPAQSDLVQSAVVTSLNRVNQVTTRDLSLRMQLIANNDELYYYDAATDPYTGDDVGDLIGENTPNVNSVIGRDNYDYGHIYTQGDNNGVAFLRASCGGNKAGGATSRQTPENDPFDIDYVAHEMGHNFGGNHTQNNSCNYSSSAGMEPGSASTIMGYAGICSPNVQTNSDDYYHGRSIEEITTHFEFGNGGCGTIINSSLNNPTVTEQADETIPFGTPFVLKAAATGDGTLSYNWEQYDTEQGPMPPEGTSALGPLFRSVDPVPGPERYFPNLPAVIAGTPETWEVTPLVTRDMSFRSTIRNVNAAYGCAGEDDIAVSVDGTRGPFLVTDPNQANQWSAGQTAQIQWDVAGTNQSPVASSVVDILLSTDGGEVFQPLLSGTPNDGYAEVAVPTQLTDAARIMVRSADNVFYNVSTLDFSIVTAGGSPDFVIRPESPVSIADCFQAIDEVTFTFTTLSSGGATAPISWSISGLPDGVTAAYSVNPTRPGGYFEVTLSGLSGIPVGQFQLELIGNSSEGTDRQFLTVERSGQDGTAGPATLAPSGFNTDLRPLLIGEQAADGSTYDIQISDDPGFSNLLYAGTDLDEPRFALPDYLSANTTYYWRIRASSDGGCGTSSWSEDSFTTGDCQVFSSTAGPVDISPGRPDQIAEMTLPVDVVATITDLDVYLLDISHTYISDLAIDLVAAGGTTVRLWDRECGRQDDILTSFDDESIQQTFDCPPVTGQFLVPTTGPLSAFDGSPANGSWTLRVTDEAEFDGGTLNGFSLKMCLQGATLPVTFLSFSATGQKDHIVLDWATAEEVDNFGFYVERSPDGSGNWDELGFVAAGADYRFDDRTARPDTDYFYRLRQQDLDGRTSYSDLRAARFGSETATSLKLFPNPTNGLLRYQLSGAAAGYDLIDVNGRLLESGRLRTDGGTIDLARRPAGVYYLRTTGSEVSETVRVVKL